MSWRLQEVQVRIGNKRVELERKEAVGRLEFQPHPPRLRRRGTMVLIPIHQPPKCQRSQFVADLPLNTNFGFSRRQTAAPNMGNWAPCDLGSCDLGSELE